MSGFGIFELIKGIHDDHTNKEKANASYKAVKTNDHAAMAAAMSRRSEALGGGGGSDPGAILNTLMQARDAAKAVNDEQAQSQINQAIGAHQTQYGGNTAARPGETQTKTYDANGNATGRDKWRSGV